LPLEGNITELIVGFFDRERSMGERFTAKEINEKVADYCGANGLPARASLTEENLSSIRLKRTELFSKWEAVIPGEALELPFDL
jgi:hypothetical protein